MIEYIKRLKREIFEICNKYDLPTTINVNVKESNEDGE